jgi:hypothetical protein
MQHPDGHPRRYRLAAIVGTGIGLQLLVGCAVLDPSATRATRPLAFPTPVLEQELQRGASTKTDVEELLGQPNGTGSLLFPAQEEAQEIWFYERIEVKQPGGSIQMQQDVLLVFFRGDVFDGFMWFSDGERPEPPAEAEP